MLKNIGLLFTAFLLMSCYPMGTYQGPGVLPDGKETAGIGISWMTNIIGFQDSSSGKESAFLADGSLLFRRGYNHNVEAGIKLVGRPWSKGAVLSDVKWQFMQQPFKVAVDFGLSYWTEQSYTAFVGYHPTLMAGGDKLFVVAQYNYFRSRTQVLRTSDLMLGRHIKIKNSDYTLTPMLGLHHSSNNLDDLYYSLGFGFTRPLDKWSWR
ncbi:hypothetical protein HQ531_14830 [bacterium]|nr:hypothetical protein [bacterium]